MTDAPNAPAPASVADTKHAIGCAEDRGVSCDCGATNAMLARLDHLRAAKQAPTAAPPASPPTSEERAAWRKDADMIARFAVGDRVLRLLDAYEDAERRLRVWESIGGANRIATVAAAAERAENPKTPAEWNERVQRIRSEEHAEPLDDATIAKWEADYTLGDDESSEVQLYRFMHLIREVRRLRERDHEATECIESLETRIRGLQAEAAERAHTPATTAPDATWEAAGIRRVTLVSPPAEPFPRVTAEDFAKLRAVQAEGERLGALTDCIDRELADEPSADAASEVKRLAQVRSDADYRVGAYAGSIKSAAYGELLAKADGARVALHAAIDALAARAPTVTAAEGRTLLDPATGVTITLTAEEWARVTRLAATAEPPADALGSSVLDEVRRLDAVVQATHRYLDAHGVPNVVEGSSTLKERVHWLAEQRGCAEADAADWKRKAEDAEREVARLRGIETVMKAVNDNHRAACVSIALYEAEVAALRADREARIAERNEARIAHAAACGDLDRLRADVARWEYVRSLLFTDGEAEDGKPRWAFIAMETIALPDDAVFSTITDAIDIARAAARPPDAPEAAR